ncbi:CAP domain-containing protein [Streptomyces griseochromogenes]|uniref:CAP domain-containing protein n=1 Tax=Streptomyces griseochromogenes TaxID=68214 RepID=UPI00378C829D
MGRHRRSAAGRAAEGRATGVTDTHSPVTGGEYPQDSSVGEHAPMGIAPYLNPEAYAEANARSTAYLYAMDAEAKPMTPGDGGFARGGGPSPDHRHRKRVATPVRTGLLGVSAAVAIGTIAVTTGVIPGLDNYRLGGSTHTTGDDRVQAAGAPSNSASEQGGTSGSADSPGGGASATHHGTGHSAPPARPASPSVSASPSAPASSAPASPAPTEKPTEKPSEKPKPTDKAGAPRTGPSRTATKAPTASSAPVTVSARAAAEAEVLKLVNEERAKVGCSPLAANSALSGLAESFSDDMAARDFFDHTDPDGATPWDRAAKAGITDLGGENIARGQADAAAVMRAWMNSPGHRANILNCDFKTLGVGVHLGTGGPWWTQDFGY